MRVDPLPSWVDAVGVATAWGVPTGLPWAIGIETALAFGALGVAIHEWPGPSHHRRGDTRDR